MIKCIRCDAELLTLASARTECSKPASIYDRYMKLRKPGDPPVGHTLAPADYSQLMLEAAEIK